LSATEPGSLAPIVAACDQYHYAEALRLGDVLAATTDTAEVARYRGIALGKLGQWPEAVATLEHAVEKQPADAGLLVDLANAQGQLALTSGLYGKFTGARQAGATLERAVALAPENLEARSGLFLFYINVPGIAGGGREKAFAQLAEIERLSPLDARLGRAELANADKDYVRAFALFASIQHDYPQEFRAFYAYGRIAAVTGREPEAGLASLRQCLTLRSNLRLPGLPGVHLRMGDILRKRGDLAGARRAYQDSLALFPEYPSAREALAALDKS
jgi:tetratricopeptide (TPR) repeat protein